MDYGWPQVSENTGSEAMDKGELLYKVQSKNYSQSLLESTHVYDYINKENIRLRDTKVFMPLYFTYTDCFWKNSKHM